MSKQDSNSTNLSFTEETALKVLPGTPVWFALEPNGYSDFGGEIITVQRKPLNASRQNAKGVVTGVDAAGGFTHDFVFNGLQRLSRGFFFSNLYEQPDTRAINSAVIPILSINLGAQAVTAAAGLGVFAANDIVCFTGFSNSANNGITVVTSATAVQLAVTKVLQAEFAIPTNARVQQVGAQFLLNEAQLAYANGLLRLNLSTTPATSLGLSVGQWVFMGGDLPAESFSTGSNKPGYARIQAIQATNIFFDKTTWLPAADVGTGKTVRLWFGNFIRNEDDPALIVRRSFQLERTLGNDGTGLQSEYLVGAIPNEMTFNIPKRDKVTVEMKFVAMDSEIRTGTQGLKAGTRVAALADQAFNTSGDVWRSRLSVIDPTTSFPTALGGIVSDGKVTIGNGVTPLVGVGVGLGAFEATAADFMVGGQLNCYFFSVAAISAIKQNANVTYDLIVASNGQGFVLDIPLLQLGGGRLSIEKDNPIMLPLNMNAAKGATGMSATMSYFACLPAAAMPIV
jgi:hypothetical protein